MFQQKAVAYSTANFTYCVHLCICVKIRLGTAGCVKSLAQQCAKVAHSDSAACLSVCARKSEHVQSHHKSSEMYIQHQPLQCSRHLLILEKLSQQSIR